MAMNFPWGNRAQAFAPTSAFPLNANSYFESYDLALAAALTAKPAGDTTTKYYFGQEIAVAEMVNNVPQSAKLYIIAPSIDDEGNVVGTLNEVGSATDGDGASIELIDGVLSIKDFGKRYYKYVAAVEGGEPGHYELVEVDDDQHKWHTGLEPRIDANGNIAWYEQNTDTVDGMQGQISGVQEDVKNLDEVLNAEGGLVDQVEDLQEEIGHAATEAGASATGLYAELEKKADADSVYTIEEIDDAFDAIEETLKGKANAADVYTKTEADTAIATAINNADHLKRKIFDTLALAQAFVTENADTANQYIYMIPVEGAVGSNKYHEYMVLEGALEEVGNWEVDLSDYFTEEELTQYLTDYYTSEAIDEILANYAQSSDLDGYYTIEQVDNLLTSYYTSTQIDNKLNDYVVKEEGKSLVSNTEIEKLATISSNAEKNYISAVDNHFTVTDGTLILSKLQSSDVGDLASLLGNKVDKVYYTVTDKDGNTSQVEGALLSPEDKSKLDALVIGDAGVEISGKVNASNVQGLDTWITDNRDNTAGLFSTTDATKLSNIQEGAEKNFITAVDDAQFTVSADGKLQLINAPLFTQTSDDFIVENDTLKLAKEFVTTQMYAAEVGDLAALIHASGKEDSTLVDEINYINERLEWQEI